MYDAYLILLGYSFFRNSLHNNSDFKTTDLCYKSLLNVYFVQQDYQFSFHCPDIYFPLYYNLTCEVRLFNWKYLLLVDILKRGGKQFYVDPIFIRFAAAKSNQVNTPFPFPLNQWDTQVYHDNTEIFRICSLLQFSSVSI